MRINISVHHVAAMAMPVYHNVIDALVLCVASCTIRATSLHQPTDSPPIWWQSMKTTVL